MNIDPNQMKLFMNWLPQSTKENLLNHSAKSIGEGVGSLFDILFYYPRKAGIYFNGKLKIYAKEIADNVSKIPVKNRSNDKLGTTFKIMSDSKYCVNNKVLRSWFAKLVASSVDSRVNSMVSNYFPMVLSNMDTNTALFLEKFKNVSQFPIGNLNLQMGDEISPFKLNIIDWNWNSSRSTTIFKSYEKEINLLSSFNIINIDFERWMSNKNASESYKNIKNAFGKQKLVNGTYRPIKIDKGIIRLTPLGKEFVRVTVP